MDESLSNGRNLTLLDEGRSDWRAVTGLRRLFMIVQCFFSWWARFRVRFLRVPTAARDYCHFGGFGQGRAARAQGAQMARWWFAGLFGGVYMISVQYVCHWT